MSSARGNKNDLFILTNLFKPVSQYLYNYHILTILLNVLAVLIVIISPMPAVAVFFHQFALAYFFRSKDQKTVWVIIRQMCRNGLNKGFVDTLISAS